jgi:hypothetical protein
MHIYIHMIPCGPITYFISFVFCLYIYIIRIFVLLSAPLVLSSGRVCAKRSSPVTVRCAIHLTLIPKNYALITESRYLSKYILILFLSLWFLFKDKFARNLKMDGRYESSLFAKERSHGFFPSIL